MIEYLNVITTFLLVAIILFGKGCLDHEKIERKLEHVNKLLEFIGNVPRWLHYYNNIHANEQLLRDKKERLHTRMEDLSFRVEEEEHRTSRLRKREVNIWLTSVVNKEEEIETILGQIDGLTTHFYGFLHRAWLGSWVEIMIQRVDDLFNSGSFEEVLSPVREIPELVIGPLVGAAAEKIIERILVWLDTGVTMIGVHGIAGVGKTAIMMHVHNQLLKRASDLKIYMIQVPENFREDVLQRCIAKELGYDLPEEDGVRRAAWLNRALERKNFVLILDGLERYFSVENVGIPRGKLVISTRSPNVCRRMGCPTHRTIAVDPLVENDALALFKRELKLESPLDPALEELAMEIVEQCQGVPKRIIKNAIPLRRIDDINVWRNQLSEMLLPNA